MRDLGGGEMLSKLAVEVGLGLRFALVLLGLRIWGLKGDMGNGGTHSALDMAAVFIPVWVG